METRDLFVSVTPSRVADIVIEALTVGSVSGRIVDQYTRSADGREVVVLIVEKYFMRTSNRATLTLIADNFDSDGRTKVRLTGSGGGSGAFMKFDWGAGASFSAKAEEALAEYRL
ncbi:MULTISPECIES: DUF6054 family protein [Bhargavaea]|uniref:DUF6054 family protein n=1 Tax=Bhargavaea changchunensis TaxID=2134037 RepID=A0ABW2NJ39_9BACL|nr:DUF6054 family protein [Bhargavaea sp. CC-171006]